MLGIFRWILAILVMLAHLSSSRFNDWTGTFAVWPFFLLAGWFSAKTIIEKYGQSWRGCGHFLLNRALRLYPAYLVALVLGAVVVLTIPEAAKATNKALQMPASAMAWAHNLLIFGLSGDRARLVPIAWFLDVLMMGYLGIAILVHWRKWGPWICVAASAGYSGYLLTVGADFDLRYASIFAVSLPLSLGAGLFLSTRNRLRPSSSIGVLAGWTVMVLAGIMTWLFLPNPRSYGFYVSLAAASCLLVALVSFPEKRCPLWLRHVDRFLGSLSYPIFLLQWPVGAICVSLVFHGDRPTNASLFLTAVLPIHLLALVMVLCVMRPIEKYRRSIRTATKDV